MKKRVRSINTDGLWLYMMMMLLLCIFDWFFTISHLFFLAHFMRWMFQNIRKYRGNKNGNNNIQPSNMIYGLHTNILLLYAHSVCVCFVCDSDSSFAQSSKFKWLFFNALRRMWIICWLLYFFGDLLMHFGVEILFIDSAFFK